MAGEQRAGILNSGGALVGGFEEVAHLSGDVAESRHGEEMRERDCQPILKSIGNDEGADDAADGAFPGFVGGDVRGEGMFADGATDEIGSGVGGPGDG